MSKTRFLQHLYGWARQFLILAANFSLPNPRQISILPISQHGVTLWDYKQARQQPARKEDPFSSAGHREAVISRPVLISYSHRGHTSA